LEVPVYGDGTAKRDFTYVGDIINGVEAAVYKPFPYEIINLGGSKTHEVHELISIIEKKLGKKANVKKLPPAEGDVPVTCADVGKAERLLGFKPEVGLDEGVGRYVSWFLGREKSGATEA
ncbi:MAG: GDP-mannose 4,6-dehydratase, partial [Thermodesulfobacteriota bacterium]